MMLLTVAAHYKYLAMVFTARASVIKSMQSIYNTTHMQASRGVLLPPDSQSSRMLMQQTSKIF